MGLSPGTELSHYRLVEKIGEGGMGEVWRASDTKLARDVAIKVLPDEVAGNAERLARFEREAKLLASLNHHNIASIYGLHHAAGVHFLEMELVEGSDLADRLRRGPLPVDTALEVARQVADGLEAAHDSGIIHRDLKPANIKLSDGGTVKILDFGLAKAIEPPRSGPSEDSLGRSPTLTSGGTLAGAILGTAAYMSPEQARGERVDQRADVWAFGCVLYEMLTGRRAFAGDTVTEILGAILHKEADLGGLPGVPRGVRRVLERCLKKELRQRLHHICDARIEIEDALAGGVAETAVREAPRRRPLRVAAIAGALLLGLVAGALGTWGLLGRPADGSSLGDVRFTLGHPGDPSSVISNPLVAPDGRWIAYEAQEAGTTRLYLRELEGREPRPLPGTESGRAPFVSPDGRWIGFFTGNALKKIAVGGGIAVEVAESAANPGGAWGEDGTIVFSRSWTSGLVAVPASGGTPETLTTLSADETGHWAPSFLPGGRRLIYTAFPKQGSLNLARLVLLDLDSGETRPIGPGAYAAYVVGGHLLYFRAGVYELAPFDLASGTITGPPETVLGEVPFVDPEGSRERFVSASANGVVAFIGRDDALVSAPRSLQWLSRDGMLERLPFEPRTYNGPALSPDGARVAFAVLENGEYDIWVSDLAGTMLERITRESNNHGAVWRPDGRGFAFISTRLGSFDVFWKDVAAGSPAEPLMTASHDLEPGGFTPDGRRIAIERSTEDAGRDLVLLDTATQETIELVATPADEFDADISPDGRWIAYVSDRSGPQQVYVQPLAGGTVTQVSRDGGTAPRWQHATNELLFVRWPDLLVADWRVDAGRFVAGRPRPFATGDGARHAREHSTGEYSPGPDPARVLVQTLDEPLQPRVHVIVTRPGDLPSTLRDASAAR